jgi:hypothetical protein
MPRAHLHLTLVVGAAALAAACSPAHSQQAAPPDAVSTLSPEALATAQAWAASLTEPQRGLGRFPFDAQERYTFNYVPMVRGGVPLGEMTDAQKAQADTLLKAALSADGFAKAKQIIGHEDILRELERERGVANYQRRNPALYYLALFGEPTAGTPWGWRFEGHHLSVNVTHGGSHGDVVAPLFFGANPARVPAGPHKGLRILAAEEDVARALVTSFAPAVRARVVIAPETTNEIVTKNAPKVDGLSFDGVPAADMTPAQRTQLRTLIEVYAKRLSPREAASQLARIDAAGFDKVYFAWAGGLEEGQKHYYRVHGPTFLIEYDNSQNDGNHIHSIWRDLERDFGGDLLRQHLAQHKH